MQRPEAAPFKSHEVIFTMEQEGRLERGFFILSLTEIKLSWPPDHSAKNIYDPATRE